MLMDRGEFLKREIKVKNILIDRLLLQLYNNSPRSDYDDSALMKSLSSIMIKIY